MLFLFNLNIGTKIEIQAAIMSEMLGNQYFLSRRYALALKELEKALSKDPENKKIQRKLIICYTQVGEVKKAIIHFLALIKKDIRFILDVDPISEDCPCPELVYKSQNKDEVNPESLDYCLIHGMLWLFCDLKKSLTYFKKAQEIDKNNSDIKFVIIKLTSQLEKENELLVRGSDEKI